jgi:hypothetical protein
LGAVNRFGEVLESIETLPLEEQQELVSIIRRRLREHRRAELALTIKAAHGEFSAGRCQPGSPDEIVRDLLV